MHACSTASSPAHSHHLIAQSQHLHTVLHFIPNVLAQQLDKQHGRIHTTRIGTMQGPKFFNAKRLLVSSQFPYDLYTITPFGMSFKTKNVVGVSTRSSLTGCPLAVFGLVTLLVTIFRFFPAMSSTLASLLQRMHVHIHRHTSSPNRVQSQGMEWTHTWKHTTGNNTLVTCNYRIQADRTLNLPCSDI